MKWLHAILIIGIIAAAMPDAAAQEADQYLEDVLAAQQDEGVFLRWTIKAGNTCEGTRIQRSEDGITYEKIGEIPGVCGSPDVSVSYDFIDTTPVLNRINYYRLEMGLLGYSSPVPVEYIILNEEGYSIQPNPVVRQSVFRFDNPDGDLYEFCLINTQGQLVYTMMTSGDRLTIDSAIIPAGTYIFKLLTDSRLKIRGKMVVL